MIRNNLEIKFKQNFVILWKVKIKINLIAKIVNNYKFWKITTKDYKLVYHLKIYKIKKKLSKMIEYLHYIIKSIN